MDGPNWITILTSGGVATLVSIAVNHHLHGRALKAKHTDRLYEFNKLELEKPDVFWRFWTLANCKSPDYFKEAFRLPGNGPSDASTSESSKSALVKGAEAFQYRAIAHYYLNMFEEMYFAHKNDVSAAEEWSAWCLYFFRILRHNLIKQILFCDGGIYRNERGEVCANGKGDFSKEFVNFLCENESEWRNKEVDLGEVYSRCRELMG